MEVIYDGANNDVYQPLNFQCSSKMFVGELSTLECVNGYDGDMSVILVVVKANKHRKEFRLAETHKNDEGEITHWTYKPVDGSDLIVKVYND